MQDAPKDINAHAFSSSMTYEAFNEVMARFENHQFIKAEQQPPMLDSRNNGGE
jgi:hypothetical protein